MKNNTNSNKNHKNNSNKLITRLNISLNNNNYQHFF